MKTPETPPPVKIKSLPHAKVNPFQRIHDEHRHHRMRTGWIIAGSAAFAVLVLAVFAVWTHVSAERQAQAYWDDVERRLNACDQQIASLEGYNRLQSALRAVAVCQEVIHTRASFRDEISRWEIRMESYLKIIQNDESNTPKENEPFICPSVFADMAYIPPGKFFMGKRSLEPGVEAEMPRHEVEISQGFWMGRSEITFGQWWQMGDQAYRVPKWANRTLTRYDYPVCAVNWHNAVQYCRLLNQREKNAGRLPEGYEYRLPTEAEWEYACRAGTQTYYPWNSDSFLPEGTLCANVWDRKAAWLIDQVNNLKHPPADGAVLAWRAGYGRANAFGLSDMTGNVYEWCYDWYNPNYRTITASKDPVQKIPVTVRFSKQGVYKLQTIRDATKVIRGGSWARGIDYCRSAARDYLPPANEDISVGFRIVLAPRVEEDFKGPTSQEVVLEQDPDSERDSRNLNPRKFEYDASLIP